MQQRNDWNVEYPSILFMERVLASHSSISGFRRTQDILFTIERTKMLCGLVALLVNRYTISLADVITAKSEFPSMSCIVAIGNWCGYTREAKEYGLRQRIGVFNMGEFCGALYQKDPVSYVAKDHNGKQLYAYRSG